MPDLLRLSVFEDREVVPGEVCDRIAVTVHHPDVERHQHDAAAKGAGNLTLLGED
jgi:hypothetical protein